MGMTKEEIPSMNNRVIINTGSTFAHEGLPGQSGYSASKAAIASMTLPLARELSELAIRVVTVAPGLFESKMLMAKDTKYSIEREYLTDLQLSLNRLGKVEEFADLCYEIVQNPMLNGCVIRQDSGARLVHV